MAQADRSNAHVRRGNRSARKTHSALADEAQQLLDNPAFIRGFDGLRDSLIKAIESGQHDGSPEFEAAEREMCRTLRNLYSLKGRIRLSVSRQALRVADYKPVNSDEGAE